MSNDLPKLLELITSPHDNRLSANKIGLIVACTVFTREMLVNGPHPLAMWMLYMGTVGGFYIILKAMYRYAGGKEEA